MSLRINDKNIYLNDTVISQKTFLEQDIVEVVKIQKEYQPEFYDLKNKDICDNIEIYCDIDNYSLNLFKEQNQTFISKAIEIFDKDETISIESFNELIKEKFSNISGVEVVADDDSIEDSLNILLSTQLNESESIKDAHIKIDNAYNKLIKEIF